MSGYLSHTPDQIASARAQGQPVYALDTANAGEDDHLIGNREQIIREICQHHDRESLPAEWSLDLCK